MSESTKHPTYPTETTTTSPHQGKRSEVESNSDPIRIEIYLFSCGQGDTILLHVALPDSEKCRWVLIDCCLWEDGTREEFFDFLKAHRVKKLDLIVQTHADLDHFLGMEEVLRYFTSDSRSLGHYMDGWLDLKSISSIITKSAVCQKYKDLQRTLKRLLKAELVKLKAFDVERSDEDCYSITDGPSRVRILPLFPAAEHARIRNIEQLDTLERNANARLNSNDLALVLALQVDADDHQFNVFFASDAHARCVRASVTQWRRLREKASHSVGFDLVKVPHHGSRGSFTEELIDLGQESEERPVAMISCGDDKVLPDRFVLEQLLAKELPVYATCARKDTGTGPSPERNQADEPLEVAGKPNRRDRLLLKNRLDVSWSPRRGLTVSPEANRIVSEDLEHYHYGKRRVPLTET